MGRVSIKTQITRKSIGKIDNQMSSGINLTITPHSFSPGLCELDFEHRMQYLTKHPLG